MVVASMRSPSFSMSGQAGKKRVVESDDENAASDLLEARQSAIKLHIFLKKLLRVQRKLHPNLTDREILDNFIHTSSEEEMSLRRAERQATGLEVDLLQKHLDRLEEEKHEKFLKLKKILDVEEKLKVTSQSIPQPSTTSALVPESPRGPTHDVVPLVSPIISQVSSAVSVTTASPSNDFYYHSSGYEDTRTPQRHSVSNVARYQDSSRSEHQGSSYYGQSSHQYHPSSYYDTQKYSGFERNVHYGSHHQQNTHRYRPPQQDWRTNPYQEEQHSRSSQSQTRYDYNQPPYRPLVSRPSPAPTFASDRRQDDRRSSQQYPTEDRYYYGDRTHSSSHRPSGSS